ncbi:MAG TPA: uroporphyrinogen-III synthase [Burkholderiales bacterium]|nr:uroporphyrinogen-III synthase [Burkholderiales bacterium]
MPLAGAGILVTRPAAQAGRLAQLVREAGGLPVLLPALEIEPLPQAVPADVARGCDLVIFVSPNAVRHGLQKLQSAAVLGTATRVAAIGPGTAAELKKGAVGDIISPRCGYDSEALAAELSDRSPGKVLIVRGQGGRGWLGEALRGRGATVSYFECYRRSRPAGGLGELLDGPVRGRVRACTATSSSIVENLFEMGAAAGAAWLRHMPFFVSHPRVAAAAFARGVRTIFVTGNGDAALTAGLVAWFARERPSRD